MRRPDPLLEAATIALGVATGFVVIAEARAARLREEWIETLRGQQEVLEQQDAAMCAYAQERWVLEGELEEIRAAAKDLRIMVVDGCPGSVGCHSRFARDLGTGPAGDKGLECLGCGHRWRPEEEQTAQPDTHEEAPEAVSEHLRGPDSSDEGEEPEPSA